MHPCSAVSQWQAEHCFGDEELMCCTGFKKQFSIAVALAYTMFADDPTPAFMFGSNVSVETPKNDELIGFRHSSNGGVEFFLELVLCFWGVCHGWCVDANNGGLALFGEG